MPGGRRIFKDYPSSFQFLSAPGRIGMLPGIRRARPSNSPALTAAKIVWRTIVRQNNDFVRQISPFPRGRSGSNTIGSSAISFMFHYPWFAGRESSGLRLTCRKTSQFVASCRSLIRSPQIAVKCRDLPETVVQHRNPKLIWVRTVPKPVRDSLSIRGFLPRADQTQTDRNWVGTPRSRLALRRAEKPATKAGQIRALWPDIEAALAVGQSIKSICAWLAEDAGIPLSVNSFTSYVSRIRRREKADRGPQHNIEALSAGRAAYAPAAPAVTNQTTKPSIRKRDPLADIRSSEANRPGFHYRPANAEDEKDLV